MELKQVIIIRQDLQLPKGKAAAQAAHASVEAAFKTDKDILSSWRRMGQKKVVLKVQSESELFKYAQQAKDAGLPVAIITDAGKTVIAPGTTTAIAIGPADEEQIDSITRELGML